MLHAILLVLSALILGYTLLVLLRVLMSWVAPHVYGKPWDLLRAVVDPYLSVFRRLRFLHKGAFDYSSLLAVIMLIVAFNVLLKLATEGAVTLGFVLSVIVSALWSGAWFMIVLLLAFGVLRLIPILFHGIGGSAIWKAADMVVYPVVAWIMKIFKLGPKSGYTQYLLLTLGLLFAALLLGELVFRQIGALLLMLPV